MIDLIELMNEQPAAGALSQPPAVNIVAPCYLFVKVDAATLLPSELADGANFLQHRILTNQAYNYKDERIGGAVHRFTILKAKYLCGIIPKRIWKRLIQHVQEIGLVQRSHYVAGEKSFGYRIGDRFAGNPTILVKPVGKRIYRKIRATRKSRREHRLRDKTYRHLLNWIAQITIPESHWADIEAEGFARHVAGGGRLDRAEYGDYVRTQLIAIRSGCHRFGVDNYGRVHSSVSSLVRPARARISIHGEPVVEIDIANSQPVFLTELLMETFGTKSSLERISSKPDAAIITTYPVGASDRLGIVSRERVEGNRIEGGKPDLVDPGDHEDTISEREDDLDHDHKRSAIPADVTRWMGLVESGTLYDKLMCLLGWDQSRRGEFKTNEVFAVLYGNPTRNNWRVDDNWIRLPPSQLKPLLAELFPTVWAFIIFYHNEHGHGSLARELQRRESRLMIRGVCGILAEQYPAVPVLTCHDSILTTVSNVGLIRRLILDQFARRGLHPTLKTTGMPTDRVTLTTVASVSNNPTSLS